MNALWKRYKQNVKKPQRNLLGYWQLKSMNKRHNALALWGMEHVDWKQRAAVLDIGCGGGQNISNLLACVPKKATVWGCDYAQASVKMSLAKNAKAVAAGRTQVQQCAVEKLLYFDNQFDTVTAFETIYFWNLAEGFREVYRVLQQGGVFLIVNEAQTGKGMEEIMQQIGFSVYTADEISNQLQLVGFRNIIIDAHPNGYWLAITAQK